MCLIRSLSVSALSCLLGIVGGMETARKGFCPCHEPQSQRQVESILFAKEVKRNTNIPIIERKPQRGGVLYYLIAGLNDTLTFA